MKTITHWIPTVFCAFLLVLGIATDNGRLLNPIFYGFLAICFALLGAAVSQAQNQIRELKAQIAALQGKDSV